MEGGEGGTWRGEENVQKEKMDLEIIEENKYSAFIDFEKTFQGIRQAADRYYDKLQKDIEDADESLDQAKASGRNKVISSQLASD